MSFIENLQAPTEPTGWGHGDTSNQNWGFMPGGGDSNAVVAWGTNVPICTAYIPISPVNPHAAARRVRDDFLCSRRFERMRIPTTNCNHIFNPSIHSCGDNWEGPVTQ